MYVFIVRTMCIFYRNERYKSQKMLELLNIISQDTIDNFQFFINHISDIAIFQKF